jgi:hypothetical protein
MNRLTVAAILLISLCSACNNYSYTPRSKRIQFHSKPSILVFSSIADFRVSQDRWPVSLEDLKGKDPQYVKALEGFQYTYTHFRAIDSNHLVFTFANHINDVKNYNHTGNIDLNSLNGTARFSKKHGKFVWKVKMK